MCLHPPQAYNLGRFIGRFGATADNTTFVATHSSQILRGVILTAEKLQIVRLTRGSSGFLAHLVPSEVLTEILARPTVRAESVLDGIFAHAVAVVEGDGDRAVYQAVWETLREEYRVDIHFAVVGGSGGIADTCRLYRTLRIPLAVIADLDIITDSDRFRRVIAELDNGNRLESLLRQAADLVLAIKQLPPTVAESEVKAQLESASGQEMDWVKNTDAPLRQTLLGLAHSLDRMGRLKRGGLGALPQEIAKPLKVLIDDLMDLGLFLVPVGELEEWLVGESITASKQNKWAWANDAAARVRQLGAQDRDIWNFMREVGAYVTREFARISTAGSGSDAA
jgi:hypothetical protein